MFVDAALASSLHVYAKSVLYVVCIRLDSAQTKSIQFVCKFSTLHDINKLQ